MQEKHLHTIPPVFDERSKVLILGSFPSPKSREVGFFYGHPQNRFWRVISAVLEVPLPKTVEEKCNLLLKKGIAMWDVLQSCEINGASDASIRNAIPNDFSRITSVARINAVFTTGAAATRLYHKFTGEESIRLPSTSPANAAVGLEKLIESYSIINEYLK